MSKYNNYYYGLLESKLPLSIFAFFLGVQLAWLVECHFVCFIFTAVATSLSLRHCAISPSSGSKLALCQEHRRRLAWNDSSDRWVWSLPSMSVHAENALSASTDVASDVLTDILLQTVHEHTRDNQIIYCHPIQIRIIGFPVQPPVNRVWTLG